MENFLSHSAGIFSVFQKKSYSQQNLRKNDGAGITSFCRNYFLSLPIVFAGELSVFQNVSVIEKNLCIRRAGGSFIVCRQNLFSLC